MKKNELSEKEKEIIANTPITFECFTLTAEIKHLSILGTKHFITILNELEEIRLKYLETGNRQYLNELIELLPNCYKIVYPEFRQQSLFKELDLEEELRR